MKFGYARVSTHAKMLCPMDQLEKETCDLIMREKYTGIKTDRPVFNQLLEEIKEEDTIVVTKLDRLARNVQEGIQVIEGLFDKGVRVHVLNVGMPENTTMGRFFLQTMLAVAEIERNIIIERVQEGKASMFKPTRSGSSFICIIGEN